LQTEDAGLPMQTAPPLLLRQVLSPLPSRFGIPFFIIPDFLATSNMRVKAPRLNLFGSYPAPPIDTIPNDGRPFPLLSSLTFISFVFSIFSAEWASNLSAWRPPFFFSATYSLAAASASVWSVFPEDAREISSFAFA